MKIMIDECYELNDDYQNLFLGNEVFPEPSYSKVRLSKRTINSIRYENLYVLEPLHYYYVTFKEEIELSERNIYVISPFFKNGLIFSFDNKQNRMYLFNASQNMVYIQKGTQIGEVFFDG